jgi:DNA-binding MarR family transcriptional regulator
MKEIMDIKQEIVEIEWVLRRISAIIKQKGREILSDFPITPPQFVALQWLKEHGDMTIGDLSAKMYLANSTTTDLVDRMEKSGLVMRVRSNSDRRVVQIHLLDKGREIIEEVIRHRQEYLQEVLSHFPEEKVKMIHESLHLLFNEIDKDGK